MANRPIRSIKYPGLSNTYTFTQVDPTLTQPGQAADAKVVGDELNKKITDDNIYNSPFEQGQITLADSQLVYQENNYICRLPENNVIPGYVGAKIILNDKANYLIRVRRAVTTNWTSLNSGNWVTTDIQLVNNYKYVFDIRKANWNSLTPEECEGVVSIIYPRSKTDIYDESYYKTFSLKDELVFDGYFDTTNNGIPSGSTASKVTCFIKVKAGMTLSYKLSSGQASGRYIICLYDTDYQFVSGVEGIGENTLTIVNDGYVRIGNFNNYEGYVYFNFDIPDKIKTHFESLESAITVNGTNIAGNYDEIQVVIKEYLENIVPYKQAAWRVGYISPTTGKNATGDTWISLTSSNFVGEYMGLKYIETDSGYLFNLAAYEEDGTYIGAWDGSAFSQTWNWKFVNKAYLPNYNNYKYRITVKKLDDSVMTTDDYNKIIFWFKKGNNQYMENGLNAVVASLKQKSELGNLIVFGFNTDQHIWSENKGAVLRGLSVLSQCTQKYPFDFICLGGDGCEAGAHSTSLNDILDNCIEIQEPLYDAWCPVIPITGNHDAAQNNQNMNGSMLFNAHFKRIANSGFLTVLDNTHTNGYWDSEGHKVRFIFLDDTVRADYTSGQRSAALSSMLVSVPEGYKIIVFSHHVLSSALTDTGWANPIGLQNVLSPYADKIICCVCGHSHKDISETKDGILYVATTMAALGNDNDGNVRRNYTPIETAFDVFVVDQENLHIYAIRYGAGTNRDWTYTIT